MNSETSSPLAYSIDEIEDKQTSKLVARVLAVIETRRHKAFQQEDGILVSEFDILEQKILQEFIVNRHDTIVFKKNAVAS